MKLTWRECAVGLYWSALSGPLTRYDIQRTGDGLWMCRHYDAKNAIAEKIASGVSAHAAKKACEEHFKK